MELIDRIFYAAIEEYKEAGLKFTMDSLAARLGISKRTLYENISSKNEVVELVINRIFKEVKEQQKQIVDNQSLNTLDKIKDLLKVIPKSSELVDFRRVNEIKKVYPGLYKKIESNIESDWDITMDLLKQAQKENVIKDVNLVIVKALLCQAFEGLLDGEFLIQNNISYEEALTNAIDIILCGICTA